MITYQVEKPEKGAGLIEYTLKYITLFFVVGIGIWAVLIYVLTTFISDSGLTESIYNLSLVLSLVLVLGILTILVRRLISKLKQGSIYEFQFDDKHEVLIIKAVNEYSEKEILKEIPYQSLIVKIAKQKVELKAEMTISIYSGDSLFNTLKIVKTPWTVHPQIVELINKLRTVSSNNL